VPRLSLTETQREILGKWSRGGSTPYRLVIRSKVVLLAAQGCSNRSIARRLGINPITVARWRSRFLLLGVEGLRREAPRLGAPPRVSEALVRSIIHKTLFERPAPASRWSTRSLAGAVGVSHSTVRRIWKAYDVRPPRSLLAALGRGRPFHPKTVDVVGIYVNPPQRAVAISFRDEEEKRSRARASDPAATPSRSHPEGRSWVTDLVTTLHLLDGRQFKGSAGRLSDSEFLSFLQSVLRAREGREQIQLLAESDGPTPSAPLTRWLQRYPEFSAHVQVGGASVQQLVVEWLGEASNPALTDRPPASLPDLRAAIERWARDTGTKPRPFAWTR
jgi:transcriptional regulator with XRE-family HTH domain